MSGIGSRPSAAESPEIAAEAVKNIKVDYDVLKPVLPETTIGHELRNNPFVTARL